MAQKPIRERRWCELRDDSEEYLKKAFEEVCMYGICEHMQALVVQIHCFLQPMIAVRSMREDGIEITKHNARFMQLSPRAVYLIMLVMLARACRGSLSSMVPWVQSSSSTNCRQVSLNISFELDFLPSFASTLPLAKFIAPAKKYCFTDTGFASLRGCLFPGCDMISSSFLNMQEEDFRCAAKFAGDDNWHDDQ
jgi:hypothetical protein